MSKAKDSRIFDFGVSTHPGRVRLENQDYMAGFDCINGYVFIVCDGMGGPAGGSVASKLAVDSIQAYLENHYFDLPEDALKAAIEFANSMVFKKSKEKEEYRGMGATIVMAMVRNEKVHYAHVGDSRIYLFNDGRLHRLTHDHSHVQNLVDKGIISEDEARKHPERNIITRALGISPIIEIEFCSFPVTPAQNDYIMLCTDGLYGMLEDDEIANVLKEDSMVQEKADKLMTLANEKDGSDNITVQLLHFNNTTNRKAKFAAYTDRGGNIKPIFVQMEQAVNEPIEKESPLFDQSIDETEMTEQTVVEHADTDETEAEQSFDEDTGAEVVEINEAVQEEYPAEEPEQLQQYEDEVAEQIQPAEAVEEPEIKAEAEEMFEAAPVEEEEHNEPEKTVDKQPEIEKPVIDRPVVDHTDIENPVVDKPVADKPVADKPVHDKPVHDKPVYEKPVVEKSYTEKPYVDISRPKAQPAYGNTPYSEEKKEKGGFLNRFGFYRKLNDKPSLKSRIRMALIILGVVFIAFVFWDLFIKQSASTKINDTPEQVADTLSDDSNNDTVAAKQGQPVKPDTIWISYSVRKGEVLGKISMKFGVPLSFIKTKNKLKNDMIGEKQKLQIPTRANHLVKPGESVAAIAAKYSVDKNSILKANDLKDESGIKGGQGLIIPFK